MEQERIDVSAATPVTSAELPAAARPQRRGMPLWLQLIISLVVIAAAAVIAALFNPTANALMAKTGWAPPLLNQATDATSAPGGQGNAAGGQGQSGRGGQTGGQGGGQSSGGAQTQTAAQPQGQGQGQGQSRSGGAPGAGGGRGGFGGFGASRTAVVVTAAATTAKINDKLTAIGEGSAIQSVTVTPSSSGTLISVNVKPGDRVAKGAAIASLDNATQQIAYDQANLAATNAQAALTRTTQLSKASSATAVELSAAKLAFDTAKLQLSNASLALSQRTITSPIDGTVGIIQVLPGNIVSGTSVVTTVEDASNILVNFWVPERYASQLAIGMPVAATSSALPGQTFEGKVSALDNRVDAESRTLQVQATIPNSNNTITPGMSFTVSMTFPGQTFPAVDPLAVQWSNQGAYVWKLVDGKVQKGMVEIVQRNSDGVLVKGDVKDGDQVVTQGVLQLTDGAPVRLLSDIGNGQNGQGGGQAANGSSQGQTQGSNQNRAGGGGGATQPPGGTAGQAGTGGTTGQTPTGNGTGPTGNSTGQAGNSTGQAGSDRPAGGVGG